MNCLIRRGATYYFQMRIKEPYSFLLKSEIYRRSLQTKEYNQAKIRVRFVLSWMAEMNDVYDDLEAEVKFFENKCHINNDTICEYLEDEWPLDGDRLWRRDCYEAMVNNFKRKMYLKLKKSPDYFVHGFMDRFQQFIQQNIEFKEMEMFERITGTVHTQHKAELAETRQKAEIEAYKRGREEERETAKTYAEIFREQYAPSITTPEQHQEAEVRSQPHVATVEAHTSATETNSQPAVSSDQSEIEKNQQTISELVEDYFKFSEKEDGNKKREAEGRPVLDYLVHVFGEKRPFELQNSDYLGFFRSLADVPNRHNVPREWGESFALRVAYADQVNWVGLKKCAAKTITDNHLPKLRGFLKFLNDRNYLAAGMPNLHLSRAIKGNLNASVKRDSFTEAELKAFLGSPAFTGAESERRRWHRGNCVIQGAHYWCYLILLTTGMRTGEPVALRVEDIIDIAGRWYFDLRAFDPEIDAPLVKDMRLGKTENADRVVPVHPDLITLGLLERQKELREMGAIHLLPEIKAYQRKDGGLRFSAPVSKDYSIAAKTLGFTRNNLDCYSTRHTVDKMLTENSNLDPELRKRLLGQEAGHINGVYGSKGELLDKSWNEFINTRSQAMRAGFEKIIQAKIAAETGEKLLIKPYLNKTNWQRD